MLMIFYYTSGTMHCAKRVKINISNTKLLGTSETFCCRVQVCNSPSVRLDRRARVHCGSAYHHGVPHLEVGDLPVPSALIKAYGEFAP